jgi:hypothetical protein
MVVVRYLRVNSDDHTPEPAPYLTHMRGSLRAATIDLFIQVSCSGYLRCALKRGNAFPVSVGQRKRTGQVKQCVVCEPQLFFEIYLARFGNYACYSLWSIEPVVIIDSAC